VQNINYPQTFHNFDIAPKPGTHQSVLQLNASVGVGEIELIRSAPGAINFGLPAIPTPPNPGGYGG
jgi:hypothetical protein